MNCEIKPETAVATIGGDQILKPPWAEDGDKQKLGGMTNNNRRQNLQKHRSNLEYSLLFDTPVLCKDAQKFFIMVGPGANPTPGAKYPGQWDTAWGVGAHTSLRAGLIIETKMKKPCKCTGGLPKQSEDCEGQEWCESCYDYSGYYHSKASLQKPLGPKWMECICEDPEEHVMCAGNGTHGSDPVCVWGGDYWAVSGNYYATRFLGGH